MWWVGVCGRVWVAQSCSTLCYPMDCSPPDSSVHGISQAGVLEWVAISFSRGSSQTRDWTWLLCLLHWQADSLPLHHLGSSLVARLITKYLEDFFLHLLMASWKYPTVCDFFHLLTLLAYLSLNVPLSQFKSVAEKSSNRQNEISHTIMPVIYTDTTTPKKRISFFN